MIVIARLPELEIGHGFRALYTAAIDEMFGDKPHFRHMKMRRQIGAVRQFKVDGRDPGQMLFYLLKFHDVFPFLGGQQWSNSMTDEPFFLSVRMLAKSWLQQSSTMKRIRPVKKSKFAL